MKENFKAIIIGFLIGVISFLLTQVRLNLIQAIITSIICAIIFECITYNTIRE